MAVLAMARQSNDRTPELKTVLRRFARHERRAATALLFLYVAPVGCAVDTADLDDDGATGAAPGAVESERGDARPEMPSSSATTKAERATTASAAAPSNDEGPEFVIRRTKAPTGGVSAPAPPATCVRDGNDVIASVDLSEGKGEWKEKLLLESDDDVLFHDGSVHGSERSTDAM
ncbi:hypothetical protein EON77_03355, partial [bacterium]